MKKRLKDILIVGLPVFLLIVMSVILVYSIILQSTADTLGNDIGTKFGSMVGNAIGSFDGMTRGRKEGTEAGKEAGKSAEDTKADIGNQLQQMEKLEVLAAGIKLSNFHTIGENTDYAALYLANGNVVFTVDMSKAAAHIEGSELHIALPQPYGLIYVDESSIEKAAEYQKTFFTGDAKDGFDAYLNTMAKMDEATPETLNNYDVLIQSAKESAVKQVSMLAGSVASGYKDIIVTFDEQMEEQTNDR